MRLVCTMFLLALLLAAPSLAYEGSATMYQYRGENASSQWYSRFYAPTVYQDPYRPVSRPTVREAGPAALPLGHTEYNDYDDHYDEYLSADDWRWGREYYQADQRVEFDPYYNHSAHYSQRYGWSNFPHPLYESFKRSRAPPGFADVVAEAEEIVEESLDDFDGLDVDTPADGRRGFLGGDVDGPWN